ncbi:MAG: pilus assembly protein TadG-related protein [Rhodospirillales bacterium]
MFFCQVIARCKAFFTAERGGVAVYTSLFLLLAVGAGALAVDFGRLAVLGSQMQNRADAAAMAGATQLDGKDGARSRSSLIALNAMSQVSSIPGDGGDLAIQGVGFFSQIAPSRVVATGDEDSKFIEVILNPKRVDFIFSPLLDFSSTSNSKVMSSSAVAGTNPFICHAPPLMICDPSEGDPSLDLSLPQNAGRQIQLKPPINGGGGWMPGNYGLLALPDGGVGASDIEEALAAVEPEDCYTLDVGTAPGVRTNKVQNGVNARFDLPGGLPYPAPNVINYPKDGDVELDPTIVVGSGTWDMDAYWAARHGGAPPAQLLGASRYQVYLFELGLEFARNGGQTVYPIEGTPPDGFTIVTPPGADIPVDPLNPDDPDFDGVPSSPVAANGYSRRLVQVAVLQCVAEGVSGSHTYPSNGDYVELFITEAVADEPAGGIYGEVVRPITTTNDPDFHANVRLVE